MLINFENFPPEFVSSLIKNCAAFGFHHTTDQNKAELRVIVDPKKKTNPNKHRDVIVISEPEAVRPDLYRESFISSYPWIFPLGKYRSDRLNLKYWMNWPVDLPTYTRSFRNRNHKIVIVNEHKFSSSARSEYGLRREVIKYFEKQMPGALDLYGKEWSASKLIEIKRRAFALRNNKSFMDISIREVWSDLFHEYSSSVGHMEKDCEPLQNYRASICIENDIDYVSEKVWKSIYAGCPTIYIGPSLAYDQALKKCVVTAENQLSAILEHFHLLTSEFEDELRQSSLDFISSQEFEKYKLEARTIEFFENLKGLTSI